MIKHIVLWRFFETAAGHSREENLLTARQLIEEMRDKIPGMRKLEAGININPSEQSSDLVLYAEFDSFSDLEVYQSHPEHQKVKDFLSAVRYERRVIDYRPV